MSASILILFFVDMITIYYFQSRLSIANIYGLLTTTSGKSFSNYISLIIWGFFVLCLISFFLSQKYFNRLKDKKWQILLAKRFFGIAISMSIVNFLKYDNKDLVSNILTINIEALRENIFADKFGFIKSSTKYEDYFKNIPGKWKKLNVILVLAESFSTVDSKRAGGLYDNFPLFDRVQSNGITFTNFMANGCTSATAHIGLLQWVEPRENPLMKNSQAYDKYANMTDTLPEFFNKLKYQTTFISSVTLDFLHEYDFLSGLHFKTIIGEEAFEDKKKYVFGAAPDMDLYNKTLETIKQYKTNQEPYFVAIQTISSHKPYNTPYGKDTESMFSYIDKSIYAFYQKLKQSNFFDNGILVIVGDHRKMESVGTDEFNKRGASSHSRALATVIGPWIKENTYNNNIIQHIDIFNSIKYLIGSGEVKTFSLYNNIFNWEKNRDRWVRYCQFAENTYTVIKQNWTSYRLTATKDKPITNYINAFKMFQAEKLLGITNFSGYKIDMKTTSWTKKEPILIAHWWWAYSWKGLFNAPATFAQAKEDGADGIEFDVSYTKDNKNIVLHGPSMNTTICEKKTKTVTGYTLKEIQSKCPLKNKEKIMTLEEFLKTNKGLFDYYFLEIKVYDPTKAEKQTLDAINTVLELGMEDKVIFISYDRIANYIIGAHKKIRAWRDSYSNADTWIISKFPHEFYLSEQNRVNEDTTNIASEMGKQFLTYTVNTKEEYDRVRKMGVKWIMTDNIPLLKTLRSAEK